MIAVVTGGRDHYPTCAELERLESEIQTHGITRLREGEARGVDKTVRGYLLARGAVLADRQRPPHAVPGALVIEPWPADWEAHRRAAGAIRNRAMLDGLPPDLTGHTPMPAASILIAFAGGRGTQDCRTAAAERHIPIVEIDPVAEPRIWNMHHRWSAESATPPGLLYVGRSRQHGGPSPLANPFRLELIPGESRVAAAGRILDLYRRWLWTGITVGDRDVLRALDSITPDTFLGCTCWPAHCHATIIVRAWRYRQETRTP